MSNTNSDTKASSNALITITNDTALSHIPKPISHGVFAIPKTKPKKRVLEEEVYVDAVQKIIERDFFPDLPKLRTQLEWLEAEESGDLQKMREIQSRLRKKEIHKNASSIRGTPGTSLVTPSSFTPQMTPTPSATPSDFTPPSTPSMQPKSKRSSNTDPSDAPLDVNVSLDTFQMTHTSEDNSAFDAIIDQTNQLKKMKYGWMYDREKEAQLLLEAPPNLNNGNLLSWNYKAKNQLMYNADGAPLSEREEKIAYQGPPKEIVRENTRLHGNVFANQNPNKKDEEEEQRILASLGQQDRLMLLHQKLTSTNGKIDIDQMRGFASLAGASPQIGGYSVMLTPSPAPGVDASPFTTWGSIDGTPLRIEPTDTPLHLGPGPSFKMPETRAREKLAIELSEKAKKSRSNVTSSNKPKTPLRKDPSQSPLNTDYQLRASYSSPLIKRSGGSKSSGVPNSPFASPFSSFGSSPSHNASKNKILSSPKVILTKKKNSKGMEMKT